MTYAVRAVSVFLAAIYTMVSLHACSIQPKPEPASLFAGEVPLEERSTVTILQSREEIGLALQQAIDAYSTERPQVQLAVQTVANQSDYRVVLRSRLLSGQPVDLFHLFSHGDALDLEPYLEDLTNMPLLEGAMEGSLDAVTLGYSVYGAPYAVEGTGLIANRNIWDTAGISLSDVSGLEDLTDAFAELQALIDEGELAERFPRLEAVTELPALDSDFLTACLAETVLTGQFSSPAQAAQAASVSLPLGEAAEGFVRLLARYGYAPRWGDYNQIPRNEQVENGLATERVAVIFDHVSCYGPVYTLNPELENRLALLPVPLEEDAGGGIYTGIPAYWALNAQSPEGVKGAAKDFLTWLYLTDAGATFVAARFGAVSPYREAARSTGVSLHSQMLAHMDAGRSLPQVHRELPQGWDSRFAEGIAAYLEEESDWEELLQDLKEQWTALRR